MTREQILIVDDEESVVHLCERVLQASGFAVKTCQRMAAALALLQRENFDLLLLDIHLPDGSGLNMLSAIRAAALETAVILMTGYGTMEVAIEALHTGAQDFLLKPFTPQQMLASVERVLAQKNLQRENLRLKARLPILEISKALMSETNLSRLTQLVLETAQQESGANRVSLMLPDPERQELIVAAAIDLDKKVLTDTRLKIEQRLAERAVESKEPILVNGKSDSWPFSPLEDGRDEPPAGSAVCVPLMIQNRVVGVLNVGRPADAPPFQQEDVDLLSILCGQVAVALENARLFEQTQREIAERTLVQETLRRERDLMALMMDTSPVGIAVVDQDGRFTFANDRASEILGLSRAEIARRTYDDPAWHITDHKGSLFPADQLPLQQIMAQRHAVYDIRHAVERPDGRRVLLSISAAPLADQTGQVNGMIAEIEDVTERVRAEWALAESEQRFRRLTTQLRAIVYLGHQIAALSEPDELIWQVVRSVQQMTGCYHAHFFVLREDELILTAGHGGYFYREPPLGYRLKPGQGIIGRAAQTGQPVLVPDTTVDPDYLNWNGLPHTRSELAVPIKRGDRVLGVMDMQATESDAFDAADVEALGALAGQLAVAIENGRLWQAAQQEIAERKQVEVALQRQLQELILLHTVAIAGAEATDENTLLQDAVQLLDKMLYGDCLQVLLCHPDSGALYVHPCSRTFDTEAELRPSDIAIQTVADGRSRRVADQNSLPDSTRPHVRSVLCVPLRAGTRAFGAIHVESMREHAFSEADERLLTTFAGQLATALEKVRLMETLEQRVADRTRELAALYEVTAAASESLQFETTIRRTLEQSLTAMSSQIGTVHLIDENGAGLDTDMHPMRLAACQGLPTDAGLLLAYADLAAQVLVHNEPLVIPDAMHDRRVLRTPSTIDTLQAFRQSVYVGVPMRARGRTLGVLAVLGPEGHEFNVEDVALLASIADHMAVAVENDRLRRQAERTAVVEERARLARDLHDSVTQLLYSVTLFAEAGRELARGGDLEGAMRYWVRVSQVAQEALKEMRLMVYELRPSVLQEEGLIDALRQRLETVESRAGVKTRLLADLSIELSPLLEQELYHLAQEALNNALKHARADSVTVQLHLDGEHLVLQVQDNGCGFDPRRASERGGMGLASMRERSLRMGGVLDIRSASGQGTEIYVAVPITGTTEEGHV